MAFHRFVLASLLFAATGSSQVVISQVYGGGGNAGAQFRNDFIEIFNRGSVAQSLNGWSVQYASTAGTSWQATNLTNVSLQPGQYYLVQEAVGAGTQPLLPTPDATGSIAMSANAGKVALVNATTVLSGACPTAGVQDFVGFGPATNCSEASPTSPNLANTTAAFRAGAGCTDTNNNLSDFSNAAPNPRNTATLPLNVCGGGSTNPSATGSATSVPPGGSTTLSATVTLGTNPTSTGTGVSCNLTSVGGIASFALGGSGTSFSSPYTVPGGTTPNTYSLPCTVTDAQARSGNFNISLTVNSPIVPPSGTGSANPNSLLAGASTLLTVNAVAGTNAISTVTVNLTSIGGPASQALLDNGVAPDVTAGDNIYSANATVDSGTAPGPKSLPVTLTDTSALTGSTSISLTVQSPPAPTTIKISQLYGGGGNSGSTYTNDFIELYNQSSAPVDITGWSVQQASATAATWNVTPLCPVGTCSIQPGRYFLVQESAGANGTTGLPTPDASGTATMGAASGKVALVNNTTAFTVNCPVSAGIADFVGYGTGADCSETTPVGTLDNTTAAVRKGNGCIDTNNNLNDFVPIGPIPRNSSAPQNICGGDPTLPSGVGTASPSTMEGTEITLLLVTVTPASTPPSTGITVTGALTSIGGSASQQFFDDGTNGDVTPGDNIFTFKVAAPVALGAKYIPTSIHDAQNRNAPAPITITVASPTCGVQRWAVKTATDSDANLITNVNSPARSTIGALGAIPAPPLGDESGPTYAPRQAPTETTVFIVNGVLTAYKLEDDVDYHIVIKETNNPLHTMITEIPSPACDGSAGPFDALVAAVRAKFDGRFTATKFFQNTSVPVQMKGVGFFDFAHGQNGVAPNAIELHPLLDMNFTTASTTGLGSNNNPSTLNQSVTFTATVSSAGGTATGNVSFFDGANLLGTGVLASGQATFTTSALTAGAHSITASYEGDSVVADSVSSVLSQQVKVNPVVTWAHPASIIFGSALGNGQLNATANVPGAFVYNPPAGTVPPVGNGQVLSTTFTPTDTVNYNTVPGSTTIDVLPAPPASGPSVSVTRVLSRDGSNNIVVQLTLTNGGGTAATNVMVTNLKVGAVTAPGLPIAVGTIGAGSSAIVTVNMGNPVGAPGAASSITAAGTYTGGSFSSTGRITLP